MVHRHVWRTAALLSTERLRKGHLASLFQRPALMCVDFVRLSNNSRRISVHGDLSSSLLSLSLVSTASHPAHGAQTTKRCGTQKVATGAEEEGQSAQSFLTARLLLAAAAPPIERLWRVVVSEST